MSIQQCQYLVPIYIASHCSSGLFSLPENPVNLPFHGEAAVLCLLLKAQLEYMKVNEKPSSSTININKECLRQ